MTASRASFVKNNPFWGRGLNRRAAAAYVGVGLTKFDEMVSDGRMPRPRLIDSIRSWDRHELDFYYSELPHDGEAEKTASDQWADAS